MNTLPEHGVLICLKGIGIYLIGDSGVGKSEIALQLIHQGATLICDDAPDLIADKYDEKILGTCPDGFNGLMHIHDLGVINLIELIGPQVCKASQRIDLVIELIKSPDQAATIASQNPQQLLTPNYQLWHYQSCSVYGIRIHLFPGRNMPIIINTAIKQFITLSEKPYAQRN